MDWAEKYRPKHLNEILGNTAPVRQMLTWAENWTPDSAPLLLTGKPGIGKTSAALALAADMNWEVLELNASDARTKSIIEHIAGNSATTASLFGSLRKLIIIDEADNLEGNADRGGAKAIADLIKDSKQPILLIANDAYGVSDSIRRLSEPVTFRAISASTLAKRIREICQQENVMCSDDAVNTIAESANGDLRSAVNMLFGSAAGREELSANHVQTAQKDERATIFDLVSGVAGGAPDSTLQRLSWECEEKPDYIIQWIEETIAQTPASPRRIRAYRRISRADIYLGRTMVRQYYTLWKYATSLMTLGVAAENGASSYRPRVMPPGRWKRMATAKKQKSVRRSLAISLSEGYKIPNAQIQSDYLDLLSSIASENPEAFCERHSLDADQLTVLIQDKDKAAAAFKAVQKAAKEREIKAKKLSAAKKKELEKLKEAASQEKQPEPPVHIEEPETKPDEETSTEKKTSITQATLDFF